MAMAASSSSSSSSAMAMAMASRSIVPFPDLQPSDLKSRISLHPLFPHLLTAHLACLRIADAQFQLVPLPIPQLHVHHKNELDQFMAHFVLLLCTFKEQLQQHVREHVLAYSELEQSFEKLTGIKPEEIECAIDDDEQLDTDAESFKGIKPEEIECAIDDDEQLDTDAESFKGELVDVEDHDTPSYCSPNPTETQHSLMERIKLELKNELKSRYRQRIVNIREEILRKRRAGKLSSQSTSVLKSWWHSHLKWPYPAEDDKIRLVRETGLQSKQVNNWFINQRKRNWPDNPLPAVAQKIKRNR